MIDYKKTIEDLRNADNLTADHKLLGICERAADAIEDLQAELDQWKAAVKGQEDGIKVLQAEVKRYNTDRVAAGYCYQCKHIDKSPLRNYGYGKCKLMDMTIEAVHEWGCTDWEPPQEV